MGRASSFQPSSLPSLHAVAPDLKAFTAGMPPPTAQISFGTDLSGQRGFPGGSVGKESACNAGDLGPVPGLGRSPGEGNPWLPTPVFWPGEFHGHKSLMGYSLWGHKKSDTIDRLSPRGQRNKPGNHEQASSSSACGGRWESPCLTPPGGQQLLPLERTFGWVWTPFRKSGVWRVAA